MIQGYQTDNKIMQRLVLSCICFTASASQVKHWVNLSKVLIFFLTKSVLSNMVVIEFRLPELL